VPRDELGPCDEALKCCGECSISILDGGEEAVVGRRSLGGLPYAFDPIELRRVRREPPELDSATIFREPPFRLVAESVAWTVVDDQEDLSPSTSHQVFQKEEKRGAVEDRSELIRKARTAFDGESTEDVTRLAQSVGIDARLAANRRPGPVQASVEPEARFVLERYDASACGSFFLINGKVVRSQIA